MEVSEREAMIGLPDVSMHSTVSRMQVQSSSINQAGTSNVSMNPVATESRYAPFLLHKLLPVCKPLQRQLIESAGFGFLFRLPLGLKPDPPLCIWLLSRFETQNNAIKLDGGDEHLVTASEIKSIIGVPRGEIAVCMRGSRIDRNNRDRLARKLSAGFPKASLTMARARQVLLDLATADHLSAEYQQAFVIAVVLTAIGTIVAPRPGVASAVVDDAVIEALLQTDKISSFDWAQHSLNVLKDAAEDMKRQLSGVISVNKLTIYGCTLFLVVFYLQRCTTQIPKNINNEIPLVWNFTAKFIRECLARDMASRESMRSWKNVLDTLTQFPQTTHADSSTANTTGYTTEGDDQSSNPADLIMETAIQSNLEKLTVRRLVHDIVNTEMSEILRGKYASRQIPENNDYDDDMDWGKVIRRMTTRDIAHCFINWIETKFLREDQNYQLRLGVIKDTMTNEAAQCPYQSASTPSAGTSIRFDKTPSTTNFLSSGVPYGRYLKRQHPFNDELPIFDISPNTTGTKDIIDLEMRTTEITLPFQLRFWDDLHNTLSMTHVREMCHAAVQCTESIESVWVSIDNPCNVRLTGKTISALFCDNSEMTEETMTAIMCVLNEFDETLDSFSNHQHWRTFLPALSLGAAEETYSTCLMQLPSNWTQCVDSISQITPVSLTAMVFVPILIRGYWHCFALNIKYKHVHVQMAVSESGNYIVHEKIIKEISVILLKYLFEKANRGRVDHAATLEDWQFKFAHVKSLETIGNNGFATCLYALLFDGTNFRDDILSTLNSKKTRRSAEEIVNVETESDAKATLFSLLLDRQENPLKLSDLLPHLTEATA